MDTPPNIRISVPRATQEALTFCETTAGALSDWSASLPMANTHSAAKQVGAGVREVAALITTASSRLELLEVLRPSVHYLATRLDRAAAQHGQQADELGTMAQQLQTMLCIGYKAVVRDSLRELEQSRAVLRDVLPKAIHRGIADLSRQHLRTLQLYVSPPPQTWLEPNQLFLLAETLELSNYQTDDAENHQSEALSITDAYLRLALMSCCKPNQLRYQQLSRVFNALEDWCSRAMISTSTENAQFAIDLAADAGPTYAALKRELKEPRGIRTDVLVYEIDAYLKDIDSSIPVPDFIDPALLGQLAEAWGKISPRSQRRISSQEPLMVCVGLRSTHYHLSGGIAFSDQVNNTEALLRREVNPFLNQQAKPTERSSEDVWDDAFDLGVRIPVNPNIADPDRILVEGAIKQKAAEAASSATDAASAPEDTQTRMRYYETLAEDTSPSGYCMRWPEGLPGSLQAGELLAVREASDPRWCLAVLRWIRQDQEGTTTGIELLAPRAVPVAIRVIQKKGGPTDFARSLLLPELKPIGQPATLITPRVPFSSGQKIQVHRQGVQTTAALNDLVASTDSFNQFTFRMLDGYLENSRIDLNLKVVPALSGDPERGTT